MQNVEVRFVVPDEPNTSDRSKEILLERHKAVSPIDLQQIWNGSVPGREYVTLDIDGTAVSIMDDWQCTIFGSSYLDCLRALFTVHSTLSNQLGINVTLDPLETSEGLEGLIREQQRNRRMKNVGLFVLGAAISAGISVGAAIIFGV